MSEDRTYEGRRISSRTPLYNSEGDLLGHFPPHRVLHLIGEGKVRIIGTKHRITALKFLSVEELRERE